MTTLPLRQLLRDPKKVKQLTNSGQTVRITDGGEPLWDIVAPGTATTSPSPEVEARQRDLWESHFEELLSSPLQAKGVPSITDVLAASRGDR